METVIGNSFPAGTSAFACSEKAQKKTGLLDLLGVCLLLFAVMFCGYCCGANAVSSSHMLVVRGLLSDTRVKKRTMRQMRTLSLLY